MYYMHGGKVYGKRTVKGVPLWQRVAVQNIAGDTRIVGTGDNLKKLPPGAIPMTAAEVLARFPATQDENSATMDEI